MDPAAQAAIRVIVDLLVRRQYDVAAATARGHRLNGDDLRRAVNDYGRTLTMPETDVLANAVVTPIVESTMPAYHVALPLWTQEEGLSDLTLELELAGTPEGVYETTILDLHAL
jgi:hypothetical protein